METSKHVWKIPLIYKLLDPPKDIDYEEVTTCLTWLPQGSALEWELVLTFNESNSKNGEWLSLDVRMAENFKPVNFNFRIWMENINGTHIRINEDEDPIQMDYLTTFSIPRLLTKDGLFVNFEEYTPGGTLKFVYEIDVGVICSFSGHRFFYKRDKINREAGENKKVEQRHDEEPSAPKRPFVLIHNYFKSIESLSASEV